MELESWRFKLADEDIATGRLWKARDRLHGLLVDWPTDQGLLDRLGDVHYRMGDLPQAGRYWWLTIRDDEAARRARDAFYERFGTKAPGVLSELPRPARPEFYPPAVRSRLEELVAAARKQGMSWTPRDWPRTPTNAVKPPSAGAYSRFWGLVGGFLVVFFLLSLAVGIWTVAEALLEFFL